MKDPKKENDNEAFQGEDLPPDSFENKLLVNIFNMIGKLKVFERGPMRGVFEDLVQNRKRSGAVSTIKGWINKERFDVLWDLYKVLDGKIQKQETKFRTVSKIVTMINSIHSLEKILHELTYAGKDILEGTDYICFYWLRDGFLTYGYSTKEDDMDLLNRRIPIGMDFAGNCALKKQSFLSNDPANDERIGAQFMEEKDRGIQSIMEVPVVIDNDLIGVLEAVSKSKDCLYSDDDLEILETLANAAAIAIRNVQLIESAQKKLSELRMVTKEKDRLWDKLLQSEKLAAVGQLTAGLGHEIGNIIIWLDAGPKLMERIEKMDFPGQMTQLIRWVQENKLPPEFQNALENLGKHLERVVPETIEELTVVQEAKQRLGRIATDFREYNKSVPATDLKLELHDINRIISGFKMLERKLKSSQLVAGSEITYKLELELQDGLPKVMVDKSQFQDILLNLCFNAVDSMPNGGTLRISSDRDESSIYIRVSDTGMGIPPENLHKVFNPFFTTKAKGTGLGLSICYNVIKLHRGTMWAESEVGKGTTFVIKLPIYQEGEPEEAEAPASENAEKFMA